MKYFLHDTNSLDDEKVTELFMNFGYEGVGLFYCILEKIGKQEKPVKTIVLKRQLSVGKKLEKCWNFMESLGLIHSSNDETFNKNLLNFSEKYKIKKENNAKRISEWREKQTLTENVTRNESVRNTTKVKESKVNRSKENEIDFNLPIQIVSGNEKQLFVPCRDSFLRFYKEKYKTDYLFTEMDGNKLHSILKKIVKKTKEKFSGQKEKFSIDEITPGFDWFYTQAYEIGGNWIQSNYSLKNLDTQFNELYSTIKNGKQTSKNGTRNNGATAEGVVRKINEAFSQSKSGS